MKYLFFDLEYATSKHGVSIICEFGYVLVDESFNILERDNFIIDPNIPRTQWDYWVVRTLLKRSIREYESNLSFPHYYDAIRQLFNEADYVIGHSLNGDAKALNDDCKRYDLPSLDYEFYDVRIIYRNYSNNKNDTSVKNMLKELNISGEKNFHDAGTDAYNTMLELKYMLESLNITFEELIELCPDAKDETINYTVKSFDKEREINEARFELIFNGDGTNNLFNKGINRKRYADFLDNVKPNKEGTGKFKNKRILLSPNYEMHHFRQTLNLAQMIVNEGGSMAFKLSKADMLIKYDVLLDDGTIKEDSHEIVLEAINDNANIEIINFEDLLKLLGISEEELDSLKPISFDFLFEEGAIIRDKKDRVLIKAMKERRKINEKEEASGSTIEAILKAKGIDIDEFLKIKE